MREYYQKRFLGSTDDNHEGSETGRLWGKIRTQDLSKKISTISFGNNFRTKFLEGPLFLNSPSEQRKYV